MAISLENLIDLPLLTYYDENIKRYVVSKLNNVTQQASFTTRDTLPVEGQEGILYIVEDSILYWNGARYVTVGSNPTSVDATVWGKF